VAYPVGLSLVGVALVLGALPAWGGSATAGISVEIVEPITVQARTDLVFGRYSAGAGGGAVTVAPDGTCAVQGDVALQSGPGLAARLCRVKRCGRTQQQ